MGTVESVVIQEQFGIPMASALRYVMNDFKDYFRRNDGLKLKIYSHIDDVRQKFPHIRVFVYKDSGNVEFSMPIIISKNTQSQPIFEAYLKEAMFSLADYFEDLQMKWRASWFEHNYKSGNDHCDSNSK